MTATPAPVTIDVWVPEIDASGWLGLGSRDLGRKVPEPVHLLGALILGLRETFPADDMPPRMLQFLPSPLGFDLRRRRGIR